MPKERKNMETKKRIIKVEELGEVFTFYFTQSATTNLTSHSIKPFIEFFMKAIPKHEKKEISLKNIHSWVNNPL